ncbi:hypothetical protein MBLNU457_g2999t2 [Dothideomycetes sp. NU457]
MKGFGYDIPRNQLSRMHALGVQDNSADLQERHELFLLGEGEKKVTETPETRVPNASVFLFQKEDHTLGNLLRGRLVKSPQIIFAAYKVPHPLFANFELRVQTDGSLTPKEAVVKACADIVQDLQKLDQEFTKEWELKKIAGAGNRDL